ncbi:heavy metal translocating P-type ATPase [Candidatus Aerophobetes bacterium]|uniref:Heavy metal translocating P-type ATPase n=1 Tax=Aerophobetes bacterium TaxID=2030807 RepID=A0A2A4X2L9_UNCAE|nr:MAG: heavy metal translocating P-type ATPase [Candidatus Aerophobetes bacterium]
MQQDSPFEEARHFLHYAKDRMTSPFLTRQGRGWSNHWGLKCSIFSTLLFLIAFTTSFFASPITSALLIIIYFVAGTPALIKATEKLARAHISIDTLMVLAAFLSFIIGSALEGALLLVLFALSEAIEDAVSKKNQASILALDKLAPTKAVLVEQDGTLHEKSIHDIPVGSEILIRPGDIVPLDGIITKGSSSVQLSHLTGEPLPIYKEVGSDVPAGSQNLKGSFNLQVTRTSSNSTLAKMQKLMQQAQDKKPKIQTLLERLGRPYATSIIAISTLLALILPLIFPIEYLGIEGSIYRALSFLIAASPCALIIATPTAYLASISSLMRKGILVKGGTFLDALSKSRAIAFDKTGTLTTGLLTFDTIKSLTSSPVLNEGEAEILAYSLSLNSDHPISKSITQKGQSSSLKPLPLTHFEATSGYGISALISFKGEEQKVYLGRAAFLLQHNKKLNAKVFDTKQSSTTTYLMVEQSIYALIFTDTIREEMSSLMDALKKSGMTTYLLSGDQESAAIAVAEKLHIDKVYGDLTPDQKLSLIDKLSQEAPLAMIGDGINDAPALKRASVGLSMGQVGNPTAIEAADIVFTQDNLHDLPLLIKKAKKTKAIITQNFVCALAIIFGISIPSLFGIIPLFLAVILHEGSTIIVGLNSLRLLKNPRT